ncbi:hypothetical protein ILYODFUR_008096 [Ilyodon furcidens]|uniref:Uncharacterized protein n=1 Tax=Ilyodon furcidens TaxID=33524 RepID=A0ABV0TKW0_9TELE
MDKSTETPPEYANQVLAGRTRTPNCTSPKSTEMNQQNSGTKFYGPMRQRLIYSSAGKSTLGEVLSMIPNKLVCENPMVNTDNAISLAPMVSAGTGLLIFSDDAVCGGSSNAHSEVYRKFFPLINRKMQPH